MNRKLDLERTWNSPLSVTACTLYHGIPFQLTFDMLLISAQFMKCLCYDSKESCSSAILEMNFSLTWKFWYGISTQLPYKG